MQGWKNHDFFKIKKSDFLDLNKIFHFFKFVFSCQGFTKFLKLVCLLNRVNNMATMLVIPGFTVAEQKVSNN